MWSIIDNLTRTHTTVVSPGPHTASFSCIHMNSESFKIPWWVRETVTAQMDQKGETCILLSTVVLLLAQCADSNEWLVIRDVQAGCVRTEGTSPNADKHKFSNCLYPGSVHIKFSLSGRPFIRCLQLYVDGCRWSGGWRWRGLYRPVVKVLQMLAHLDQLLIHAMTQVGNWSVCSAN